MVQISSAKLFMSNTYRHGYNRLKDWKITVHSLNNSNAVPHYNCDICKNNFCRKVKRRDIDESRIN
jgi:hypothetical protein